MRAGLRLALFVLTLPALAANVAWTQETQDYPARAVRFIVGPGPDLLARVIAQKLSESLGRQFYVEPLPGAGGIVAAQTTAKSPPDGHTLLLTTGSYSIMQALHRNLPFNLQRDFTPVSLLGTLDFILAANPDLPATSLKELLDLARARPGTINCASSGRGTTAHLGCEMLRTFSKVDIVHVPYSGAAAAVNDLVGKHVDIMFLAMPQGTEYVKAGQLRGLAVTGPKRAPALPDIPTVAEAGLKALQFVSWNGVHVPAGTPPGIVAKLNTEMSKALDQPDVRERMAVLGLEPRGGSTEDFDRFMKADIAQWAKVVADTGLTGD